jgi:microcystin-dependent protein
MDNKLVLLLLIAVFLVYKSTRKEGFSYRRYGALQGSNNMVLTDGNGNLSSIQFPKGIIVLWNGLSTNVPEGWTLCDGTSGSPDLRGKFVLGVDPNSNNATYRTIGQGAGSATNTFTLTKEQIPPHTHKGWMGDGNNSCNCGGGRCACGTGLFDSQTNEGGGQPITLNNMPPYLVLAYIMKL